MSGPWKDKPTIYEYYVLPQYRLRVFDLFAELLTSSGAEMIETQSNDSLLTVMLHAFSKDVASSSNSLHDKVTTNLLSDAIFRQASPEDAPQIGQEQLDSRCEVGRGRRRKD